MFYKIDGKVYVKVSDFYAEVEVKENDNIVPKALSEETKIYNPSERPILISVEEVLKEYGNKNNEEENEETFETSRAFNKRQRNKE